MSLRFCISRASCSGRFHGVSFSRPSWFFAPNGSLVDSITFGPQTNNISEGRYPDGGFEFRFFTKSTPSASNVTAFKVESAAIDTAGNVTIRWQSELDQTYRVQYKRDLSEATWNDLSEVVATGAITQKQDTINSDATRFYRIVNVTP